jgi:hypothetical protein
MLAFGANRLFHLTSALPVQLLDVLEIPIQSAMLLEQHFAHSPNLFEDGI